MPVLGLPSREAVVDLLRRRWYLWPAPFLVAAALLLPLLRLAQSVTTGWPALAAAFDLLRGGLGVATALAVAFLLVLSPFVPLARRLGLSPETTGVVVGFLVLAYFTFDPFIGSDGYGYYSYLRSAVFDGDWWFGNDYTYVDPPYRHVFDAEFLSRRTPIGRLPNYWSLGPAILWAPLFAVGHAIALAARALGSSVSADGFSFPYVYLSTWGTALCGLVSLLAVLRVLREQTTLSSTARIGVAGACFFGTPLFMYSLRFPCFPHAIQSGVVALYLACFVLVRNKRTWSYAALSGGLLGFAVLCYWQTALLLVFPLSEALGELWRSWRRREVVADLPAIVGRHGLVGLTVLAFMLPQTVAWRVVWGSALVVPQGDNFMRLDYNFWHEVLFSGNNGILWWSPLVLVGFLGLFWLKDRAVVVPAVAFFVLLYLHHTRMHDWYGGGGFGPRRFTVAYPLVAMGVAALVQRLPWKWPLAAAGAALSVAGVVLGIQLGGGVDVLRDPSSTLAATLAERLVLREAQLRSFFLETPLHRYFSEGLHRPGSLVWGVVFFVLFAGLALAVALVATRLLDRVTEHVEVAEVPRRAPPEPETSRRGHSRLVDGKAPAWDLDGGWGGWAVVGLLVAVAGFVAWRATAWTGALPGRDPGWWGLLPRWDPTVLAGLPTLATVGGWPEPLTAVLALALPAGLAIGVAAFVMLLTGAVGAWLLLRELDCRPWAAVLGGVVFSCNSALVGQVGQGLAAASWVGLPWVLLGFEAAVRRTDLRWAALGGVALALQLVVGDPVWALFGAVAVATYALAMVVAAGIRDRSWTQSRRTLAAGAVVLLVGLALAAPRVAQIWTLGTQSAPLSGSLRDVFVPVAELVRLVVPGIEPAPVPGFAGLLFSEPRLYLGLVPLGCVLLAVGARRDRRSGILGALGLVALLAALGLPPAPQLAAWLVPAVPWTPPARILFVVAAAWSLVAGLGADWAVRRWRWRWLGPALFLLALVDLLGHGRAAASAGRVAAPDAGCVAAIEDQIATGAGLHRTVYLPDGGIVPGRMPEIWGLGAPGSRPVWLPTRYLAYGRVVAGEGRGRLPSSPGGLRHRMLAALGADLVCAVGGEAPTGPIRLEQLREMARMYSVQTGGAGVTSWSVDGRDREVLFATGPTRVEVVLRVPDGARLTSAAGLREDAWECSDGVSFQVSLEVSATQSRQVLFHALLEPREQPQERAFVPVDVDLSPWSGSEVKLTLATGPGVSGDTACDWAGWLEPVITSIADSTLEVVHDGPCRVLTDSGALPRAWLVRRAIEVQPGNLDVVGRCLASKTFEPAVEAVVEGRVGSRLGTPHPGDRVEVMSYQPERVELEVETAEPALLVMSDMVYPGWRATVDGVERPILPTNLVMRGVVVKGGAHRVVFEYRPALKWTAVVLSTLALCACGVAWVRVARGRRGRPPSLGEV